MNDRSLARLLSARELDLSRAQIAQLVAFGELLAGRGVELGVVAESDSGRVLERHVVDAIRAVRAVRDDDRSAYDLGSGGGLPGVPLAIALPRLEIGLVEARRRRAAWLELVVDELSLPNASVVSERIERLDGPVDVCFARALGPLLRSWDLAGPVLRPGGRLVYFAGRSFSQRDIARFSGNAHILDEPGLESDGPLVIIHR